MDKEVTHDMKLKLGKSINYTYISMYIHATTGYNKDYLKFNRMRS